MKQWQNFSAFSKVKVGVEALASDVASALEEMLRGTLGELQKESKLEQCAENLQEISGVLVMLQCHELALLTDEMLALVNDSRASAERQSDNEKVNSWKALYIAIIELPSTIEGVLSGQIQQWDEYSLLFNRVRKARNASLVFSTQTLFEKNNISYRKLFKLKPSKMTELLRQQLDCYGKAKRLFENAETRGECVGALTVVFNDLEIICRDYKLGTLWGLCGALVELLPAESEKLDLNEPTLKLLFSLSSVINQMIEDGESGMDRNLPEAILEQVLNSLSSAKKNTGRLNAAKLWYKGDRILSKEYHERQQNLKVGYFRKGAFVKTIKLLVEDISKLYDSINESVSRKQFSKDEVQFFVEGLGNIQSAIKFFKMSRFIKDIDTCMALSKKAIQEFGVLGDAEVEATLSTVAQTLYKVEVALLSRAEEINRAVFSSNAGNSESQGLVGSKFNLVLAVIKNLDQVIKGIDNYVESDSDVDVLKKMEVLLQETEAALSIVPLKRAAGFIAAGKTYVNNIIHGKQSGSIEESFHHFAHLIINLSIYLEQVTIGRVENYDFLLDESEALLHKFENTPEVEAPKAVVSLTPEPEPEPVVESPETVTSEKIAEPAIEEPVDAPVAETAELKEEEGLVTPERESLPVVEPVAIETRSEEIVDSGVDDELKDIFIEEAEEIFDLIDESCAALSRQIANKDALGELRRGFHTIKGSGRMVDASAIGDLAWSVEELLNNALSSSIQFDSAQLAAIKNVRALLPDMIKDFKADKARAFDTRSVAPLVEKISRFYAADKNVEVKASEPAKAAPVPETKKVAELEVESQTEPAKESEEVVQPGKEADAVADVQESGAETVDETIHTLPILEAIAESSSVESESEPIDETLVAEDPATEAPVELVAEAEGIAEVADLDAQKSVETNLSSVFILEVEQQIVKIRALLENPFSLDDSEGSVSSTSFLIPIHTLYGSAKVAQFTHYSNIIAPLESLLHNYPYRNVGENLGNLLIQFCEISAQIVDRVKANGEIPEDINPTDQEESFASFLKQVDIELSGKGRSAKKVEQRTNISSSLNSPAANNVSLLIEGFLLEAKTTNALILKLFKEIEESPADNANLKPLQEELNNLEGAARMANLSSIADLSHNLSYAYKQTFEKLDKLNSNTLELLGRCHAFLTSSIQLLADNKPLKDSSGLSKELREEFEQLVKSKASEDVSASEDEMEESLVGVFLEEAEELLEELDSKIADWHEAPNDDAIIGDLLRSLHTLKGGSALVGKQEIHEESHNFESFIIDSKNLSSLDKEFFSSIDEKLHSLQALFPNFGSVETEVITSEVQSDEAETAPAESVIESKVEAKAEDKVEPKKNQAQTLDEQVRVSGNLLRELLNDADEINISRNRIEQSMEDFEGMLSDMDETLGRLNGYIQNFENLTKTNQLYSVDSDESNQSNQGFDALEMDKYSEFQQIALSLLEDYDDLLDIKTNIRSKMREVDSVLTDQQRSITNLQDGLISSQMVPFAGIVPRLRRLSRQISSELGKDVTIKFSNPEGKIDRRVLQVLVNPLEHMIRNAIDHGVELPAERAKNKKPEQAEVMINLYRKGANIILDISDDGKGLDVEAIKRKAVAKGLLKQNAKIMDQDVYRYILESGFSTSDQVSKISGRGVGMDVVNNEISQIGGDLEIFSKLGLGTTFRLRLPLASSLNRALVFMLNGTQYAMLLNTIDGITQEKVEDIRRSAQQQGNPVIEYSNKSYDHAYMGRMLDKKARPKLDSIDMTVPLLLISGESKSMALQVDSIIGSKDLVVKSLGPNFSSVVGLSGAAILGNGQVTTVLDPAALIESYSASNDEEFQALLSQTESKDNKELNAVKTVLVVDDSITVRKVTSAILKRNGMNVIVAKNGVEAVEVLQNQLPDVMLLDIEMPKMDGFEVASYIRRQEGKLKELPIIMITSRIGDKHRTRAEEIGVNQYMGKPFQEQNLLAAIAEYN